MRNSNEKTVLVQIDMTPDGEFISPPRSSFGNQVLRVALVVAALATAGALAGLAFWLAMTLIPIAIAAGLIGYAIIRYRMWQATRSGGFPPFR
jgi:hypothetical protein